mmetsp:Transcript_27450/g.64574  ORF Transcript_27450/g.64574 Transcript_27450/m.64574 type:complete len:301 (+) Transcript_27450:606-1508(+)
MNGLHYGRGALRDGSHQNPRHQPDRPAESLDHHVLLQLTFRQVVSSVRWAEHVLLRGDTVRQLQNDRLDDFDTGVREGSKQVDRHPISYVAQAQCREVVHHLAGVPLHHIVCRRHDPVRDVAEPRLRLLEEVLAGDTLGEELCVHRRAKGFLVLVRHCGIQLRVVRLECTHLAAFIVDSVRFLEMVAQSHSQASSCALLHVCGSRDRKAASMTGLNLSNLISSDRATIASESRSHSSTRWDGFPTRSTSTQKTAKSSSIQPSVGWPITSLEKAHILGKLRTTSLSSSSAFAVFWMLSQSV